MSEHKHCIVSLKKKEIVQCSMSESFDFGTALEKVYPLLQIIFENLYYKDLKSAALVNNVWAKYAQEEFQRRNGASWTSLIKAKTNSQLCLEKSFNFKFDSIVFGLIFYNYSEIKLNKYVCVHDDSITRMTFSEYLLNEIIPENTDVWVVSCSHVNSPKLSNGHICYFTGAFIPQIPNIKVQKFIVSSSKIDTLFEENTFKDEHIHTILVFTLSFLNKMITKFFKKFFDIENADKIAVGGGVISGGIKPFQKDKTHQIFKSNTLFCLVMSQENKNVTADFDSYSVVIPREVCFEKKLQEFKNKIELREYSFALRICCAAKQNKELETALFNKIFPKTFIVGLDADGEFGWNKFDSWQAESNVPKEKRQKLEPNLCHEYTTIIVIMTWGKKITN